jgi:hypothetical protein
MNFTVADILLSGWAFFLFAFFLIPPGYALGWSLNLVDFRKQDPSTRFLLSLPLSIALTPILIYLAGRYSFDWPVWTIYALLFAVFAAVSRFKGLRISRLAWILSLCWIAIAIFSLVDLQLDHKLYYTVVAYDLNFRSAVTGAFARAHILPVPNPLYSNGTPQPFRYHYFWFMLCAMPVRFSQAILGNTNFTARHAVIASSAWAGLGLFSTAILFGRLFFEWEVRVRRRITLIAILLFALSGLDIIPILLESKAGLLPTIDWWNNDQVTGWLDTMLWVPHSLGALIACLTGFLILWNRPRLRWQEAIAAGIAFASATGLSIYVTLVFAVFMAAWTIRTAAQRDWPRVLSSAVAGAAAALLAFPFLKELAGKPGSQGSFLVLEVRQFLPIVQWIYGIGKLNPFTSNLGNLLALPLNYFLELGFFSIVGWIYLRRQPTSPAESAARLMLLTTVGFCTVVRSHTILMNDLGARGMLIAQFMLVLLGASWLATTVKKSWLVKATIAVGILSSVFELAILRTYTYLADNEIVAGSAELDPDDDLGLRDFSARQVYEQLNLTLPASAVLQHNPSGSQDIMAGLYANRQFAIMDLATAVTFTGDPIGPEAVLEPLKQLFSAKNNDPLPVCKKLGIDALIVKDVDSAWENKSSWVWHLPVLAKADRAIAVDCRTR